MVFSPSLGKTVVQNSKFKLYQSATIVEGRVNDMVKTAKILEQRLHLTRSPEVLLRDQIALKRIRDKLTILGYSDLI